MTQLQSELDQELREMEENDFFKNVWVTLSKIDVSEHIEKKGNLSYLSWAWAWGTLMSVYPNSIYMFDNPIFYDDGSCEVWCTVVVSDGAKRATRVMWLPVMDHKNNAIIKPNSRHISDTRMRCLTKCLAMFGLGHYIYAGEDLPEGKSKGKNIDIAQYNHIVKEEFDSIYIIKESLANGDYVSAKGAMMDICEENRKALWLAPTSGGIFTTEEVSKIKSNEWSNA